MKALFFSAAAAAVALAFAAPQAHAQTVINFCDGQADSTGLPVVPFSGQGAFPDPGNDFWNTFPANGGFSPPAFTSAGIATGITVEVNYDVSKGLPDFNQEGQPIYLLSNALSASSASLGALTILGVPPGDYSLYLYATNLNHDSSTSFVVSSGSATPDSTVNATNTSYVLGDNYVVYTHVQPDSSGTLGLFFFVNPLGVPVPADAEADLNGFQLVSAAPVSLACNPADIVSVGQQPPPDGLLTGDDYVAFINAFFTGSLLADIVSVGQQPPPDGLLTGDDYVAFINNFFVGCQPQG